MSVRCQLNFEIQRAMCDAHDVDEHLSSVVKIKSACAPSRKVRFVSGSPHELVGVPRRFGAKARNPILTYVGSGRSCDFVKPRIDFAKSSRGFGMTPKTSGSSTIARPKGLRIREEGHRLVGVTW